MSGTTLIEWLRSRDDAALTALLLARPDLATPRPADTVVLATRAGSRASVARAAENMDTLTLAVLEALLAEGADEHPVPPPVLADIDADRVEQGLDRLRELGVAWGAEQVRVVPSAREVGGLSTGGFGRPSAELDGVDVAALLEKLSEPELRLLTALASGQPYGRTKDAATVVPLDQATTPVQSLLARGLLLTRDAETVELPRQVGLAIRGAAVGGEPPLRTQRMSTVDETAAGEALESLRRTKILLDTWSDDPPVVLRAGGLGVRELRRLARDVGADERTAALLAEVAAGAGLISDSQAATPEYLPTTQADTWLAANPATQWATLALAWLELPRLPGLAGLRADGGKIVAPLSEDLRRPPAPAERRRVLDALDALPANTGVTDTDELAAVLAWRAPRRSGRLRDDIVRWTMAEATALGVVARGALTSAGRALLADGPVAAAKLMADAMPDPVDHVLVQADLTVVAPGQLQPELARRMAEVADVESAGSATVYRVGETSVRRALDAGRSAAELHQLFATRSRTPVPQALTYLIDDVARRHGRLRGGAAGSFLRCDDETLLTEVAASAATASLQLRRIAPTVLISPQPLVQVLDELRALGFAPAAEDGAGQVIDLRPPPRRAQPPRRATPPPRPPSAEQLIEVVRAMRAADRAAGSRRGASAADTSATMALLADAVRRRRRVWIGLVDANGTARQHVVEPERVGGGVLDGRDPATDEPIRIALHRITTAALIEDA